jgi:hypothetical protein
MILIGSYAVYVANKKEGNFKDIDIVGYKDSEIDEKILNSIKNKNPCKKIEFFENPILEKYYPDHSNRLYLASIDTLIALKISHLFWDINWEKNIFKLLDIKKSFPLNFSRIDDSMVKEFFLYWETIHGKRKTSDLSLNAKDFFKNKVNCPYDHDFLHKVLIKHPYFGYQQNPTYLYILKDGEEVDVCMDKFNNLLETSKFKVVFEEVAVMAYERNLHSNYKVSFHRMLKSFIINHAKYEESLWIIKNIDMFYNIPFNFIDFLNKQEKI